MQWIVLQARVLVPAIAIAISLRSPGAALAALRVAVARDPAEPETLQLARLVGGTPTSVRLSGGPPAVGQGCAVAYSGSHPLGAVEQLLAGAKTIGFDPRARSEQRVGEFLRARAAQR